MRIQVTFSLILLSMSACTIDDSNRCGKDRVFKNDTCIAIDSDPDSNSDGDGGEYPVDGGDTSINDKTPTGLGEPCDSSENCASYDADYCAKDPANPNTKGICSIANCTTEPNSCPSSAGLVCCQFPALANTPNLCMTPEEEKILKDTYGIDCRGQ